MRFRTLATDFDGRVGFRGYVGQAALHRVVAGQRVVADDGGKDLSIQVTTKKNTSKGIVSWPEDERPRERLLSLGPQAMTDGELIAILVRVGLKGISAVELGRQLLNRFGSLRGMVEAPLLALLDVKGLKGAKVAQLLAAMEVARRVAVPTKRGKVQLKGTAAAEEYLKERLRGLADEQFRITDENRQKSLQTLGTLRRKAAKRVVYRLSPTALQTFSTAERQAESCSAAELRRASKTVFYTAAAEATLVDEQLEFFRAPTRLPRTSRSMNTRQIISAG